jgi:hypothetical protein
MPYVFTLLRTPLKKQGFYNLKSSLGIYLGKIELNPLNYEFYASMKLSSEACGGWTAARVSKFWF